MASLHFSRKTIAVALGGALCLVPASPSGAQRRPPVRPPTRTAVPAPRTSPVPPTSNYWVYVGAESADRVHRVRFGPTGATVEKTFLVGELAAEMEGPHGLQITQDGRYLYMTTGHGTPDGKLWKYELGPDTLVGPGVSLGKFPASIDVTPDGLYTFSANFNLHGAMEPSSISVVYTPTLTEIAQVETCTMPHGSRLSPNGMLQYSGCMMDDQLVEIDTRTFSVARRFSVARGKEGPVPLTDAVTMAGHDMSTMGGDSSHAMHDMGGARKPGAPMTNSCSPTWAQPSADGSRIYVACNKSDDIVEVDRDSWSVTRHLKTGRGPYNLAVTPDGKYLLATLKQSAGFEVFDLATGTSVFVGKNSTTVAHGVVASPDSRYAFVSSEGVGAAPGKVDIYDLVAMAKVATVDVAQQTGGIAFWKMEPAHR